MTIPLIESRSVPFVDDGKGGTVARFQIKPNVFGETWVITRVVVSTTSVGDNQGTSHFYMYLNQESPSALLDATYNGDQDVNELVSPLNMQNLDTLIGVWTGGALGAICTAIISGTKDTGR